MTAEARASRFEPLDRARCLQLLSEHNLGRLAVVISDQPLIFPVNCTLDGGTATSGRMPVTSCAAQSEDRSPSN